jgi:predicted 3-demethylubiquinone-9 3-methyltransferase (glyoxalase superfamily)
MYDLWATEVDSSVNCASLHKHNEENNLENTFNEMHFYLSQGKFHVNKFPWLKEKWGIDWLSHTKYFITKSFQCNRQSN